MLRIRNSLSYFLLFLAFGLAQAAKATPVCPWARLLSYRSAVLAPYEGKPGTHGGETPSQVYAGYFEHRITRMDTRDAERVKKLSDGTEIWTEGDEGAPVEAFDGYSIDGDNEGVVLVMPERYRDTVIMYEMKAHELEHMIQSVNHRSVLPASVTFPRGPREILAMARVQYFIEKFAMRAEWAYLHSVPEAEKLRMIGVLKADAQLKPDSREQVIRNLTDSSSTLDEYLKKEYAAGRYSPQTVVSDLIASARERNTGPRRPRTSLDLTPEQRLAIEQDLRDDPLLTPEEKDQFRAILPALFATGRPAA